jgi:hypothetical protein
MVGKYLDEIVVDFLNELGEESIHNYKRFYDFGVKAIRRLHMDIMGAPSMVEKEINQTNSTIQIPVDSIRVIAVGQLSAENEFIPLKIKGDMVMNDSPSYGFVKKADNVFHNFGAGSVSGPTYSTDSLSGTIKVSTEVESDCLLVIYLADLKKTDSKYLVHPYDEEAILAFMRWCNIRSNVNAAVSEKQLAKQMYDEEELKCIRRNKAMSLQDMVDAWRSFYSGTIRT